VRKKESGGRQGEGGGRMVETGLIVMCQKGTGLPQINDRSRIGRADPTGGCWNPPPQKGRGDPLA